MADTPTSANDLNARYQALFDKLWSDKTELGKNVRKTAKELFPDITTPEDTIEPVVASVRAEVDEVKDKLAKALEQIAERQKADDDLRLENEMSVKIQNARRTFGLTDAGVEKMIARMKETGNYADAEAAAAWVHTQQPKPEPAKTPSWLPESANLFGTNHKDEQWAALHADPRKYMDDQLREFVRDKDRYVAETFGTA